MLNLKNEQLMLVEVVSKIYCGSYMIHKNYAEVALPQWHEQYLVSFQSGRVAQIDFKGVHVHTFATLGDWQRYLPQHCWGK